METWSTHHLYQRAAGKLGPEKAASLQRYAQQLTSKGVAVVFTLGHLSKITGVSYRVLRDTVNRTREVANYRMYAVKKRSGGRRFIHSVSGDLFKVQRFVNQEILQKCVPHSGSFAFHSSGGIRQCASMHCGARWLFQFDLTDFFYDVTEIDAYRIFRSIGYRNLLAFELARICTTTHLPRWQKRLLFHHAEQHNLRKGTEPPGENETANNSKALPYPDWSGWVGVLPQGAPTSPMLSNLAARKLDRSLHLFALEQGLVYTRYADDITVSAGNFPKHLTAGDIHRSIIRRIRNAGFRENDKKTRVAGPGSKKVVLGLLVDGEKPRISKETYRRIDRHLHASQKYGLSETAAHEGFESAFGFSNHLSGLIAFVKDVDRDRWEDFSSRFNRIDKPWSKV
jgi:RNA-directed DNA polymerase